MSLDFEIQPRPTSKNRCGLCRLAFAPDEALTYLDRVIYSPISPSPKRARLDAGTSDATSASASSSSYPSQDQDLYQSYPFHPRCLIFTTSEDALRIAESFAYRHEPSPAETKRRIDWAKSMAAKQLSSSKTSLLWFQSQRLPIKVLMNIALHLVPEYLSARTVAMWRTAARKQPITKFEVSLTTPIWCDFIDYENTAYMGPLRTVRIGARSQPIFTPGMGVDVLYVAENHSGVTQVIFGNSDNPPVISQARGVWWKIHPFKDSVGISGTTDEFKLRSLVPLPRLDLKPPICSFYWSVPPSLNQPLRFCYLGTRSTPPDLMSSVLLNVPRMSGISVCWECTTASIHVHSALQRSDFYAWESYSDSPLWHYMPLEEGERIEECWYRSGPRGQLGALGIVTSQGRVRVFGPSRSGSGPWCLADVPSKNRPTRCYFSWKGPRCLAFEGPSPSVLARKFSSPKSRFAKSSNYDGYVFTFADLEGVTALIPCRSKVRCDIVGLILIFCDGHRESVGHVRLDWLERRIPLQPDQPWYLGFEVLTMGTDPYITCIATRQQPAWAQIQMELKCYGRLEWWWSSEFTRVCYEGTESPRHTKSIVQGGR
ncbi:unnamed protein product [Clonostachys byssicola]|uniref:Uncharacterized protein n=1 Tax=Clonostachys byssicola TaxID=160290 RepID=A0A9N9UPN2_9HYPO|nr:unnamed protein product [Clonostachys byssicola]